MGYVYKEQIEDINKQLNIIEKDNPKAYENNRRWWNSTISHR